MSIAGQNFNSGATGAYVTVDVGGAAGLFTGAFTVMVLVRQTGNNVGYFGGWADSPGGTERGGLLLSGGALFGKDDFSSGYSVGTATDGEYRWVGYSKPAGSAHYRMHAADLTSLTWSHGESSGATNHGDLGTSAAFSIGMYVFALGFETADIAAVAAWTDELADLEIEAACTQAATDLAGASPAAGWLLPEAEVGTAGSIVDFTGGGADETTRQDVIASADPVDFDFTLTPATSEGSADVDLVVSVAVTGTAEHAGTASLDLTLDVAVTGTAGHEGAADVDITLDVAVTGHAEYRGSAEVDITIDVSAEGPSSEPVVVEVIPVSFSVVTGVGQCVVDKLETTPAGVPDRVCLIVPGSIVWDSCDCGQFAQTVTTEWPSSTFPQSAADQRATPCGPPMLVYTVTASIVRCVPTVDNNGNPPTCTELQAAALVIEQDRQALREAVVCCLRDMRSRYVITDFSVGNTTAVGEQGGCAGVELQYQFGTGNVCCG